MFTKIRKSAKTMPYLLNEFLYNIACLLQNRHKKFTQSNNCHGSTSCHMHSEGSGVLAVVSTCPDGNKFFLCYPSVEKLSTELICQTYWTSVYTTRALTSLCEVGACRVPKWGLPSFGAIISSVLSLTALYNINMRGLIMVIIRGKTITNWISRRVISLKLALIF